MTDKTEFFQPLLVIEDKDTTHEAVVTACATACVKAYIGDIELHAGQFDWRGSLSDPWSAWLRGRFTKSVRRVPRNFDMDTLTVEDGVVSWVASPHAHVLGCRPTTLETCSRLTRKSQVQSVDYRRTGDWPRAQMGPTIFINHALDMTTGKTAAQVSHGLLAWVLKQKDLPGVNAKLYFSVVTTVNFDSIDAGITIVDAGLTEIEPGTPTIKVK